MSIRIGEKHGHDVRKEKWAVCLVRGCVERRVGIDNPADVVGVAAVVVRPT